jgi:hypothetical protein
MQQRSSSTMRDAAHLVFDPAQTLDAAGDF